MPKKTPIKYKQRITPAGTARTARSRAQDRKSEIPEQPKLPASEDPNRKANGTFAAGNKANPEGINQNPEGLARYGVRAGILMEQLGSEEIARLAKPRHKKELLRRFTPWDVGIIYHIANGHLNAKAHYKERDALVDRIEGKAKQSVDMNMLGPNGLPLTPPEIHVHFTDDIKPKDE